MVGEVTRGGELELSFRGKVRVLQVVAVGWARHFALKERQDDSLGPRMGFKKCLAGGPDQGQEGLEECACRACVNCSTSSDRSTPPQVVNLIGLDLLE